MRAITFVFFDAGDTLLRIGGERPERFSAALRRRGIDAPVPAVAAAAAGVIKPQPPYTLDDELAYMRRWYEAALRGAGVEEISPDLLRALHEEVWWVHHATLFPDVLPVLEVLRRRGVGLGLISNAFPSMVVALGRLGIAPFFQTVVVSDLVGLLKPDSAIFRHALAAAAREPAEAAFVDDFLRNVQAASDVGMRGILIDRKRRHPDAAGERIAGLSDLLGRLWGEEATPAPGY